ncbi:MAG: formylmethanofuran dehydrogenase subunit B [Candidatus Eutrophobiaceae bacterium]
MVHHKNITCSFCGLLCDDLAIIEQNGDLRTTANACSKASKLFAAKPKPQCLKPAINGQTVPQAEAIEAAAAILRHSKRPLIAGLGADVAGMRALIALAERRRGILEHMHAAGLDRNNRVLQEHGWINTTLAELSNRADVLVFIGTNAENFPRFHERALHSGKTLFSSQSITRQRFYIGSRSAPKGIPPNPLKPQHLRCAEERLPEVVATLCALAEGHRLEEAKAGNIPIPALEKVLQALRKAHYGVILWEASEMTMSNSELTIENICKLIIKMNKSNRVLGFPLGGNDGAITANQVCAWQTGYPLRTSFAPNYPIYNPQLFAAKRLFSECRVDSVVWVSSFNSAMMPPPEAAQVPQIILARPGGSLPRQPGVWLPVATPGVDHTGQAFRMDGVVALPLRKLRSSHLPSVADLIPKIIKRI